MKKNEMRQQRGDILRRAKDILSSAERESRTDLTQRENSDFLALMAQADDLARKIGEGTPLSGQANLSYLLENLNESQGRMVPPMDPSNPAPYEEGRGEFSFVRAVRAISTGDWSGADVERRAMSESQDTAGGYLVPTGPAGELISMLKPQLIFNRIPGIRFYYPTGGSVPFPKKTSTSTAYWLGETQDITESTPEFGEVNMKPRKLGVLISVSNDLLRDASGAAEQIIRDDISEAMAQACDLGYLRGTGAANQPLGIRNWAGIKTISGAAGLYTDQVTDTLIEVMANNGNPNCWIGNPRTKGRLLKLKDGDGRPILISDMTAAPVDRLLGLPALYSTQVPTNLGAGANESELYCVDGTQIAIGIWTQFEIAASREAALWDAGAARAISAFQRDQTLIRAIMRTDIIVRQPATIAVLTGFTTT